jgi:hypothetical protein
MVPKQVICMVFDRLLRYVYLLDALHNAAYPELPKGGIRGLLEPEYRHNLFDNVVPCPGSYH